MNSYYFSYHKNSMNSFVQFKILNYSGNTHWFDYWFLDYDYITAELMEEMESQKNQIPEFFCIQTINNKIILPTLNPNCKGLYSYNSLPVEAIILNKYTYVM